MTINLKREHLQVCSGGYRIYKRVHVHLLCRGEVSTELMT